MNDYKVGDWVSFHGQWSQKTYKGRIVSVGKRYVRVVWDDGTESDVHVDSMCLKKRFPGW